MTSANKTSTKRPNREEIIDLFRACAAKNGGKAPGTRLFQKTCGITDAQVNYHFWKGGYTELAQEAGLHPKRQFAHSVSTGEVGGGQHSRSEQVLARQL